MKFKQTTANKCRYGENAEKVFGKYEILWENSSADYQGDAAILFSDGRTSGFYEWSYGSCAGCDHWEAVSASDDEIEADMKKDAIWFDNNQDFYVWLDSFFRPDKLGARKDQPNDVIDAIKETTDALSL